MEPKVRRARSGGNSNQSNVVELRPRRKAARVSSDVARAAFKAGVPEFRQRRRDESDAAFATRQRHYLALITLGRLGVELEALREIAEGGDAYAADVKALEETLGAVEAARKHLAGPTDAPRLVGAVRDALERARRWKERQREQGDGASGPDAEIIREGAIAAAPELAVVTLDMWKRAIDEWPGLEVKPGGIRRGPRAESTRWWFHVVFDMLAPAGLTAASAAKNLKNTFDAAPKKAARPSRAKR